MRYGSVGEGNGMRYGSVGEGNGMRYGNEGGVGKGRV